MTAIELAALLHGRTIGSEIDGDEEAKAKAAGLVVVYGASDDLVELRGAIDEEIGAYDGTTLRITPHGLLPEWPESDSITEDWAEEYFAKKASGFKTITADWCPHGNDGLAWSYRTDIPHETFDVYEDGQPWCRGIVFALADVKPSPPAEVDPAQGTLL